MEEYKHENITRSVIGCAMNVHNKLGVGFPEWIYERCLKIEFDKVGLRYECQSEKRIIYEGVDVGSRRVDLIVEDVVIVELKAIRFVDTIFVNQILNYLKIFKIEVGLLINFGNKSLEHNRFAHTIK